MARVSSSGVSAASSMRSSVFVFDELCVKIGYAGYYGCMKKPHEAIDSLDPVHSHHSADSAIAKSSARRSVNFTCRFHQVRFTTV